MTINKCKCGCTPELIDTIGAYGTPAVQVYCKACNTHTHAETYTTGRFYKGKFIPVTKEYATKQAIIKWNTEA